MSDRGKTTSQSAGEVPNPWGDLLREEARRRGVSQNDLARMLPFDKSTFYRWLSGVQQPSLTNVRQMAEALDIDMATAFRAAGQLGDDAPVDETDRELRMIKDSGLPKGVIERLIADTLARRDREAESRRAELAKQIDLLKGATGR